MTYKNLRAIRYTFKAYERLKREQYIDTLFRTGKAFSVLPLRVIHNTIPRPPAALSPVQAGFSVPKKRFRSSVHRHRITRLMREVWRLNKHLLYAHMPATIQLHIFFIYTGHELPVYETISQAMVKAIEELKHKYT